jgi:tRNA pseudouridine55 synthase
MAVGKVGGGQRRRPPSTDIDGVVLLDKPEGLSSNAALQRVRRCFSAAKAGHTGTLDPLATGLLPVCLGDATKFSQGLLDADKAYLATARLGIATDTGDREGRVIAQAPVTATSEQVLAALATLTGTIEQVPPMYSALKHQGQPLYAIARAGGEVARAARTVHVRELEVVAWDSPLLTFRVCCSKGTYVRTLAEQIAAALGTVGHLVALRRTAVGPFELGMSVALAELEAADPMQRMHHLHPVDTLVRGLPALTLGAQDALHVLQGRCVDPCPRPTALPDPRGHDATAEALVRVYGPAGLAGIRASVAQGSAAPTFIGVGALEAGERGCFRLRPVRLIAHVALGMGNAAAASAVSDESA